MTTLDVGRVRWATLLFGLATLSSVAWTSANAQGTNRRLTGRIIDADGKLPIAAATVRVANSTIGAATSDSGTFALRVPEGALTLTVRRIGYTGATVPVAADQNDVTISLTRDVLKLETEVVTGVATTIASKNSANDVAVLNSDQINSVPAATIENSIQGKIAGAVIQQNNGGAPGGGMQVQIRGITSINSVAEPLYVVDGVIVNNETVNSGMNAITGAANNSILQSNQDNSPNRIADLNPNDIESMEVLKGASAAAIYGGKAASGVIVITTKKGTPGAPQWDLSGQAGTYFAGNTLNLRRFPSYASAAAWYKNDYVPSASQPAFGPTLPKSAYGGNLDLQNQLFGGGQLSGQGDLSVRGATNSTNYYASVHDQYDNGIMLGTGYNKQAIRTNLSQTFSSAFQVSTNLYYQHSTTTRGITGNDNVGISPYNVFSVTPQFYNLNSFANGQWANNPFGFANPFADAAEIQTPDNVNRFIGGATATYQILHSSMHDLKVSVIAGVDLSNERAINYAPPSLQIEQHLSLPGTSNVNTSDNTYYNYSVNLIHHFTGFSWLDATTSIGESQDRRLLDNPNIVGQNLPTGIVTPTAGAVQNAFELKSDVKTQSLYAQEQILTLNQRLSLTAGLTADRNSNNGSFSRYYLYPKFAGSLILPTFAKFIDEFKLRSAFGRSGTAPTYGFNYAPTASCTPELNAGMHALPCGFSTTIAGVILNDQNLKPEQSAETEAGLDITMFGSRAQFSGTVYNKQVTDLVLFEAPAGSSGIAQEVVNGGKFHNQGIELSLQFSPIANPNGLTWISNTSFYRNYSRVDALPNHNTPIVTANQFGGGFGTNIVAVGRSISQIVNTNVTLGNGLNQQVGDATPADIISFNQQLSFGHFHLSGVLDWYVGGTTANLTNAYYDNPLFLLADSAASAKRLASAAAGGTPWVESARFVKLREVRLSWDLPSSWVKAIGQGRLRTARIDVSGRNLLWSFPYTGLDPEVSNFGTLAVGRGQDVTPYPPARSVFFGIDLGL
jgi:TonB-dependent starch-binding outer membrane protein SusC